jgi:anti-sigma regulatory factor (Ser/Thr protein kinase)
MTAHGPSGGIELGKLCVPVDASSAKVSRDLIGLIGTQWGITTETMESAQLAVSELVTNVVTHTAGALGNTVIVSAHRVGSVLSVKVHDSSAKEPVLRSAEEDDESGRGLFLVAAMTDAYGHYLTPTGKVVWFELKTDWPTSVAV